MDNKNKCDMVMTQSEISRMLKKTDEIPLLVVLINYSEDTSEPVKLEGSIKQFGLEGIKRPVCK